MRCSSVKQHGIAPQLMKSRRSPQSEYPISIDCEVQVYQEVIVRVLRETAPLLEALPESTPSPDSVTQWLNVSASSKYKDNELGLQREAGKVSSEREVRDANPCVHRNVRYTKTLHEMTGTNKNSPLPPNVGDCIQESHVGAADDRVADTREERHLSHEHAIR